MHTSFKRSILLLILMILVSLACMWDPITPNNILATENPDENPAITLNVAFTSTKAAEATEEFLNVLEEQMETRMAITLSAMETEQVINITQSAWETNEAEALFNGVKPEKIICDGEYTTIVTNLDDTDQTCSFNVQFSLEFWNVGALGGPDYGVATLYWSYIDFDWGSCHINKMTETTSTGDFSGGPDGHASVTWASIQLSDGETGSVSYEDENESVTGTCTIDNPAVFSGWTGP